MQLCCDKDKVAKRQSLIILTGWQSGKALAANGLKTSGCKVVAGFATVVAVATFSCKYNSNHFSLYESLNGRKKALAAIL